MTDEIVTTPRRKLRLTKADRKALEEQRQLEHLVSLFLDLSQDRTNEEIAQEMGLSVAAMKRMTMRPEFQDLYDDVLMKLGHHPRLQVLEANLPELGVASFRALKDILANPRASATARVAAAKLVLGDLLRVEDQRMDEDPSALKNFLKGAGVNVEAQVVNINLPMPEEYRAAFSRLMGGDVIEAQATDVLELPAQIEQESPP